MKDEEVITDDMAAYIDSTMFDFVGMSCEEAKLRIKLDEMAHEREEANQKAKFKFVIDKIEGAATEDLMDELASIAEASFQLGADGADSDEFASAVFYATRGKEDNNDV